MLMVLQNAEELFILYFMPFFTIVFSYGMAIHKNGNYETGFYVL